MVTSYFARLIEDYKVKTFEFETMARLKEKLLPRGTIVRIHEHELGGRSYINFYDNEDNLMWSDNIVPWHLVEDLQLNDGQVIGKGEDIGNVLQRLNLNPRLEAKVQGVENGK